MRVLRTIIFVPVLFGTFQVGALASECKNPEALGTSRVLEVDPHAYPLVGKVQYMETLRLRDREVVLTFDDGPVDDGTDTLLDELARQCAKATFFMIGLNAAESPELARRVYDEGHSVGFHTFSHPDVEKITFDKAKADINKGIAAVREALGPTRTAAPFYRPPYLSMTKELERYINASGMMVWSIDADSDDWIPATDDALLERTIDRLEKAGKGILLLHDIQLATVRVLPRLLAELKKRNFKLVHVVPPPDKREKTVGTVVSRALHDGWYNALQQILSIVATRISAVWEPLSATSSK
jgi:peptidoglycan/xylan/chitin deacetylase (PgdA/CDA1 family)